MAVNGSRGLYGSKFDTCGVRVTLCLNARQRAQPATIESVHHGSITSVRPTNTGTAECALSKGAPILVPAFLAAYLSSGDEIQVPLGSHQVGTEIHVRKNAASRRIRELYEAPVGYVKIYVNRLLKLDRAEKQDDPAPEVDPSELPADQPTA